MPQVAAKSLAAFFKAVFALPPAILYLFLAFGPSLIEYANEYQKQLLSLFLI